MTIDDDDEYSNPSPMARKPKEESRTMMIIGTWHAYDADGNYKGEVKLTANTKKRYESKGFTFTQRKK